jgi:ABC-type amino acid transport substrate-binding protein
VTYDEAIQQIKASFLAGSDRVVPVGVALPKMKKANLYRAVLSGIVPAIKSGGRLLTIGAIAEKFFAESIQPAAKKNQNKSRLPKAKGKRLQEIEAAEAKVLRK